VVWGIVGLPVLVVAVLLETLVLGAGDNFHGRRFRDVCFTGGKCYFLGYNLTLGVVFWG
jgi:hypothetical protein